MTEKSLKERLLEAKEAANSVIAGIKQGLGSGEIKSHSDLADSIQRYVLHKYLLDEESMHVISLKELAELSVARSLKLDKDRAVLKDSPSTCEGATSAMNKKVLLLLAIQRDLGIEFQPDKTAGIETTSDLAEAVWNQLK